MKIRIEVGDIKIDYEGVDSEYFNSNIDGAKKVFEDMADQAFRIYELKTSRGNTVVNNVINNSDRNNDIDPDPAVPDLNSDSDMAP